MRNLIKLIAVTAITALLLFALASCASADERIYTSPVFKLPADRLQLAEEIIENQAKDEEPDKAEVTANETGDEDEVIENLDDDAGEVTEEFEERRRVTIKSSQGAIVTEGDQIRLTSELHGFGDDDIVDYQWQVDRGDGLGWVNVEGANKWKHEFVANEETIKYSWRLIVNVIEE